MTVLVTGATGSVGRHVVDQLLAAGQQVRALTRNPATAGLPAGVDVRQGDLNHADALAGALDKVDRVYLFPVFDHPEAFVDMAVSAGVRRIVVLSSDSTVNRLETNWSAGEAHLATERAVERSGVEWTHVRPGGFAGNTLEWAPMIRADGVVRAPYGAGAQSLIHEADIAAVATRALLEDGHAGQRYRLSGPEAVTRVDQARLIGEALGRDVRFAEITAEQWRAQVSAFLSEEVMTMLLGYWARAVDQPDPVLPTVAEVTGRPARTFAEWAVDHADRFR
ncbi:NAD(P)H-binding protein [Goodfellowiella coeruleoviolacea]|uniref:Uncharacterized conserved protein YbjT, contains NAD(P)-binding and DUF2867 domains n=1 Tax=Goodfellowiella coeruleoviolacea TaxID=334858 RepID=A0AAE3KHC6_9PSEU|nr:NAD(P)H-binding protein [Goodfellowiella coeruleoviolacea]MCP2168156.1 Uncharacterized conserved protein YbjT, contains NAD(P)-binding and DUF2867 domains [Goodfellowiella coeruleoviolacea]